MVSPACGRHDWDQMLQIPPSAAHQPNTALYLSFHILL